MNMCKFIGLLSWLLVVQPWTANSNFLAPLLAPLSEEVCKGVECGKGTCKPSGNLTLYNCECDPGWKHAGLSFLPCVIPNCSVDYSCEAASPPAQDKENRAPKSILDPCHWMDCRGGMCNKTSTLTYNCECRANYYNLLNVSAFPCLQELLGERYKKIVCTLSRKEIECALGMDCKALGIPLSNQSALSPPGAENSTNQGNSIRRCNISWLVILMISTPFFMK